MHDRPPDIEYPTLERIRATAAAIAPFINATPVQRWRERELEAQFGSLTEVFLKLELFQRSGSFKVRGVVCQHAGTVARGTRARRNRRQRG